MSAKKLIKSKNKIEKSKEANFLANMSNALITPLNRIMGFADMLSEMETDVIKQELIKVIKNSSDNLLFNINSILELNKINNNQLVLEIVEFNLLNLIDDLARYFKSIAKMKGLCLIKIIDGNIPDKVIGDKIKLKQILVNLLNNAVKFTVKGEIVFNVKILKHDDKNIVIQFSVQDTGIGIPEDKQAKVFDSFVQFNESGHPPLDLGVGLSIVKKLTAMMGGDIVLKSEKNKGSDFVLSLPFVQADK